MGDFYIGEIRAFPYQVGKVPYGWLRCDGRALAPQQYAALYSLIGTTYGGNGSTTFNLPDLSGRVIVGGTYGESNPQGGSIHGTYGGQENITLTLNHLPTHSHTLNASNDVADQTLPTAAVFAQPNKPTTGNPVPDAPALYGPAQALTTLDPSNITTVGGGAPINNMQPYLALEFCIAYQGIYPPRQ